MIVENPYTQPHYLTIYFPIKPSLIDKDRTENGDHMKKPTQYWFVNCNPENNVCYEPIEFVEKKTIAGMKREGNNSRQVMRSCIHHQYAKRFIVQYIIDCEGGVFCGT